MLDAEALVVVRDADVDEDTIETTGKQRA